MKNKHYEMIVAKAANMDLVVFSKHETEGWLAVSGKDYMPQIQSCEYFLCLPQHKEACLHWLNGGDVQYYSGAVGTYCAVETVQETLEDEAERLECSVGDLVDFNPTEWTENSIFMKSDFKLRIKPKKEKRWIATFPWCGNDNYVVPTYFSSAEELDEYICKVYGFREYQSILIEVEV